MSRSFYNQFFNHLILALSILLVFLLIFDPYLSIPRILSYLGKLHPVILHFPIVLILLAVINSYTRNKPYQETLLTVATLTALLTAISGFLLSEDMAVKGPLLLRHQWIGSATAIFMSIWYGIENKQLKIVWVKGSVKFTLVFLIIATGHYGGMVTHGQDFLSWTSKSKIPETVIPDNPKVFEHLILPVLEQKCISCHKPDKTKGGLILSDYESIIRGGESGSIIQPGDPDKSEILRRIHLPLNDEDHMPPQERNQLAEKEIQLLEGWIATGASKELNLDDLTTEDPFFSTAQMFINPAVRREWDLLPEVEESLIQKLSSDYCTIRRLAENSNALSVLIFPHPNHELPRLSKLKPIKKNIIELDLSHLPLSDEEVNFISGCESLEWLEIDYSTINEIQFNKLGNLKKLKTLKAQGCSLTDNSLQTLMALKELEKLFIWGTDISEKAIEQLISSNPGININSGINKNIQFTSTLPSPKISPEQPFFVDQLSIQFDHPLKDINILYTLSGKDPGSGASLFKNSLSIDQSCMLKFIASKEGWENSILDSVMFYKTLNGPEVLEFLIQPDPKYMGKGAHSLFDLEKGPLNHNDSAWLGFQKNKMVLSCNWKKELIVKSITLSSLINTGIHVFPPVRIEVSGGSSPAGQKLLGSYMPSRVDKHQRPTFEFFTCPVDSQSVSHLTISVTPLEKLPEWHEAGGEPGWFFVDEVILEK